MQFTRGMLTKRMCGHSVAFFLICIFIFTSSCSLQKQIGKAAAVALADSSLQNAHVGISIYEPATGKYWYNFNGDKYFVPASNTKLPTCYAAMKYLGDSLVAGRFTTEPLDGTHTFYPSGDPTFLHPDFKVQPLFYELRKLTRLIIDFTGFEEEPLGSGWSWNDYNEDYMAERSPFPIYGNLVRFNFKKSILSSVPSVRVEIDSLGLKPYNADSIRKAYREGHFSITRDIGKNEFNIIPEKGDYVASDIPYRFNYDFIVQMLSDTLKFNQIYVGRTVDARKQSQTGTVIHSQPTDSLLKIMMHRSDNFFAEQSLLMVSNEKIGIMNDSKIIETLLKTDLKGLPQAPRWVDGCGLSRYNLFSPKDFVYILNKMKDEFGMDRLKVILPTGGRGTLSSYFLANKNRIFAKTGTLSGVVALSGFFYTRSNKLLVFSVLVNNHHGSATAIRRAVEKFLQNVCNR